MPSEFTKRLEQTPPVVRWAGGFVAVVVLLVMFRPGKKSEDRGFLEEAAAERAAGSVPREVERSSNAAVWDESVRQAVAESFEFNQPKVAYIPRGFDEASYDDTALQYPWIVPLLQEGMIALDPPMTRSTAPRPVGDTSPPLPSRKITVKMTDRGRAMLRQVEDYGDRYEITIATRSLGSVDRCEKSSPPGQCFTTFSWQYALRVPRSELLASSSMRGRAELKKSGSGWVVVRLFGIHSHPFNEHDGASPGRSDKVVYEPGELPPGTASD